MSLGILPKIFWSKNNLSTSVLDQTKSSHIYTVNCYSGIWSNFKKSFAVHRYVAWIFEDLEIAQNLHLWIGLNWTRFEKTMTKPNTWSALNVLIFFTCFLALQNFCRPLLRVTNIRKWASLLSINWCQPSFLSSEPLWRFVEHIYWDEQEVMSTKSRRAFL